MTPVNVAYTPVSSLHIVTHLPVVINICTIQAARSKNIVQKCTFSKKSGQKTCHKDVMPVTQRQKMTRSSNINFFD